MTVTTDPVRADASVLAARGGSEGVVAAIASGDVRIVELDTVHPLGGSGGSVDSDDCAWLVRTLVDASTQRFLIATRHQSSSLTNDARIAGKPPRVLAAELTSLLSVRRNVVGWVSGRSRRAAIAHHGGWRTGFWEASPLALGLTLPEWDLLRQGALRPPRRS